MDLWLLLIVMSLTTYRLTKLVVEDTFPPVLWLRDRLAGGWRALSLKESERYATDLASVAEGPVAAPHPELGALLRTDGEVSRFVRRSKLSPYWLSELISCPWCASGWVALGVTGGVWAVVGLPVPVLVWFATWAAGALLASQEWA